MSKFKSNIRDACFAIYDMARWLFHWLERIGVDVACRNLVEYYDNKKGRTIQHTHVRNATLQIKEELDSCKEENRLLQKNIIDLNGKIRDLSNKLNDAETVRDELIETNEIFAQNIQDLHDTIASFSRTKAASLRQKEKEEVQETKNSKVEELSCLYAEPDATGAILRKPTTSESMYSLYKLEISKSDEQLCTFSVLNNEATETYIANRNVSLLACQIIEIASSPTTLVTIEPGTAVKENNNWVVATPAKIKII